jgi:hypothetical protein
MCACRFVLCMCVCEGPGRQRGLVLFAWAARRDSAKYLCFSWERKLCVFYNRWLGLFKCVRRGWCAFAPRIDSVAHHVHPLVMCKLRVVIFLLLRNILNLCDVECAPKSQVCNRSLDMTCTADSTWFVIVRSVAQSIRLPCASCVCFVIFKVFEFASHCCVWLRCLFLHRATHVNPDIIWLLSALWRTK